MSSDTSNPPQSSASAPAMEGYTPGARVSNWFNILLGRMSNEGKNAYREEMYILREAQDCAQCEKWRDQCLSYSPMVRFMQQNIQDLNGKLDKENVLCRRCPTRVEGDGRMVRQSGGFSPDHGILLCANEIGSKKHMEDSLSHEMVHAWDHLRWKVDWMDLRHAACSEIRASMLSGECRWTKEFWVRNNWTLTQQFQRCVRTRAVQSVMMRPGCKDDVQAVKVVNEVWDSCFNDTRPFDEVYK